jgi:hypothetical protein
MIALVPLTIVVQIGLGALLGRVFAIPEVLERTWLFWLLGSAVLSLVGVALAAGLIGARVCGGLFILGAAYVVWPGACANPLIGQLIAWISAG